ncbi:G patch domain-containing protein 11 [Entomortierella beljakovae]|nr:G patch domain-containing protein 11 [Entomortierella beljakovae]
MSNAHDEEEEEDYMSEAFLNSLTEQSEKEKKSNMTYSERRRQKQKEHLANLPKPLHIREKEAREKGLEKEIGEENKGMAMLLKMGFKMGGTLGAAKNPSESSPQDNNSGAGTSGNTNALRVPIAVEIKQGRGGLGMDTLKRRREEEELQRHVDESKRAFDQDFRGQNINKFELDKRHRQLGAARAICMQLDAKSKTRMDKGQSEETATNQDERSNEFWWIASSVPDEILGTKLMGPGAEINESEQEDEDSDRDFDRERYDNGQRLEKRIRIEPLLGEESNEVEVQEIVPPKWGERPEFARLEVHEKLLKVVNYLRNRHHYCFWCSAQYYGEDDLNQNCPGESEDDH